MAEGIRDFCLHMWKERFICFPSIYTDLEFKLADSKSNDGFSYHWAFGDRISAGGFDYIIVF